MTGVGVPGLGNTSQPPAFRKLVADGKCPTLKKVVLAYSLTEANIYTPLGQSPGEVVCGQAWVLLF